VWLGGRKEEEFGEVNISPGEAHWGKGERCQCDDQRRACPGSRKRAVRNNAFKSGSAELKMARGNKAGETYVPLEMSHCLVKR